MAELGRPGSHGDGGWPETGRWGWSDGPKKESLAGTYRGRNTGFVFCFLFWMRALTLTNEAWAKGGSSSSR